MAEPRVSVIIIFLNEERFLAEAVNSVLAQNFRDWELLLVDDGSTDSSPAVAHGFADLGRHQICCLCHPRRSNRGMSASRNLGLAHAVGEFVAFLDADDVWLPHKLAEQVAVLDCRPEAGLVYGRTQIWHTWSKSPEKSDFFYDLGVLPDRLYNPPKLFEILLKNKAQTPTICNALMRRALFDKVGGFEDLFHAMFEDQTFFAKALLDTPAYVDNRVWARYRQHHQSCSAISHDRGDDLRTRLRFLQWLRCYVRERHDVDRRLRFALYQELIRSRLVLGKRLFTGARKTMKRIVRRASPA